MDVTPLRPVGDPDASEAARLADLSPVLLATADARGRLAFVNAAWERMLGWPAEELTGRHWLSLAHPEDRAALGALLDPTRGSVHRPVEFEGRVETKDGRWCWTQWTFRFEDGRWYGAGQDSTESHRAARELESSQARLGEAQRMAGIGSFELDLATGRLWWSEEHYRLYGVSPETFEPTADRAMSFLHPDDAERVHTAYAERVAGDRSDDSIEYRIVRADGETRTMLVRGYTVLGGDGLPSRIIGTAQDITDRRRAELAVEASERRFRALVEQVPAIVYTAAAGANGEWDYVSPQVETMLGHTPEDWIADPSLWIGSMHPDDRERVVGDEDDVAMPGGELRTEYRLRTRQGTWIWVRDEATMFVDERGELVFQGVLYDITERKEAEAALEESERRYRHLVETSEDLIWALDSEGTCTFVNHASEAILGYTPEEMVGRPYTDFGHPGNDIPAFERVKAGQSVFAYTTTQRHKDGSEVELTVNAVALTDGEGNMIGLTGTAHNVTEERRREAAVREKHSQLQAIIDNSPLIIWAKDLDGRLMFANREFTEIFDRAPGEVSAADGDRQVIETGEAIESEVVAWVRGRERTYLVHRFPLQNDGGTYGLCGIATDITERKAREDQLREKVEWSFRIRDAIESDRLVLYAQPIVDVASGKVVQEELLVRMTGEDGELIPPGAFLPAAERFGLAPAIDRAVVSKAVRLACHRSVEVNLSGQSIGDSGLTEFIESEIAAVGADPSNLVFEITETAAAEDLDHARQFAQRLAELGCGFALDDFGTGYGSFTYLKHLPVQYIKIDMDFVRNLVADAADRQVVKAIVDVARNFGIQTIAEGVESQDILDLLAGMGVDFAQGFHLGRPAPA